MTSRPPLLSADSSFDDPLTVNPWRCMVDNICQNLKIDEFQKFLFFSKDWLSADDYKRFSRFEQPGDYTQYFRTLEDSLGENKSKEHLKQLLVRAPFFGGCGEIDYKDWIKKYEEEKLKYVERNNQDPNFVGREHQMEAILEYLRQDYKSYKGVVVCGISGIGKTSLAKQVCSTLMYCQPVWNIVVINQREKSELNDLLLDLIFGLSEELCVEKQIQFVSGTDVRSLTMQCQMLIGELVEKQIRTLIFLDDMDGHCEKTKQYEFCQLMKEIISKVPLGSNVKILMTVCRNLSNVINKRNIIVEWQMMEQELEAFTTDETEKVLRKTSDKSENELSHSVCDSIHSLCGGMPFLISMVGDLIRNGCETDTFSCEPQNQQQAVDQSDIFIQKSLQMLENSQLHELQVLLVRFSLFQTACFNIHAAQSVCQETCGEEKKFEIKLIHLKRHFLLETNDARCSTEKLYSMHPLIVRYVNSLCKEDENLSDERQVAKGQFLKHVCGKIEHLGESCDTDPSTTKTTVNANMVHIKEFFKIISEEGLLLTNYLKQKDSKKHKLSASAAVRRKHIWTIAEWAISPLQRKLFARRQSEREKEAKSLFGYIYWRSLEADSLLTQDKIQKSSQLLEKVTSELHIVMDHHTIHSEAEGWNKLPDEEVSTWATFFTVKGRLGYIKIRNNNETNMHESTLQYLNIADKFYSKRVKYFQTELACVKNLKGRVYSLLKSKKENCEMSKRYHEEAYKIIQKLTNNQLHKNLTEYQTSLASCYHQLALDTDDERKRDSLFQKALELYNKSVEYNMKMKCDMTPSQAETLRKRAEIFYRQELLEKALRDGEEVNKIVNILYRNPHIEITLAGERIAHYHLEIGKKKWTEEKSAECQGHLEKAVLYYDEVLMHIRDGGLPIQYNDGRTFKNAKENHENVMKLLNYTERLINDRIRQYQEFEAGECKKDIQHNLQHDLDFDPDEFLKEAEAKGMPFEADQMDDSDSKSSMTGTNEKSKSSSRSKSSSAVPDRPQPFIDVEKIQTLKRQNNVVDETETSVKKMKDADVGAANDEKRETPNIDMDYDENKSNTDSSFKSERTEEDDVFLMKTEDEIKRHGFEKKPGSSLTRQAGVDLPDLIEQDEKQGDQQFEELRGPSTSSYADSGRESWSSFESRKSSTNESRDSWRGLPLSSSFGSQKHHDTWSSTGSDPGEPNRRFTWSSTGSRDSVTSQMGRMLYLDNLEEG